MSSGLSTTLMMVILLALMYFMMIRPQRKQQDKKKQMMSAMKPGDSVVTIGGLHGVINRIDEAKQTIELDIEGVYLTFDLRAIGRVDKQEPVAPAAAKPAETTSEVPATDEKAETDADEAPAADTVADDKKED
jgi:preprotein translocase subunit YajC